MDFTLFVASAGAAAPFGRPGWSTEKSGLAIELTAQWCMMQLLAEAVEALHACTHVQVHYDHGSTDVAILTAGILAHAVTNAVTYDPAHASLLVWAQDVVKHCIGMSWLTGTYLDLPAVCAWIMLA